MTLLDQYQDIARDRTRREAVWLVSRMMRYRVDMITGLEGELHDAMEGLRARGNRRKFRRTAKTVALLSTRIERLAQDIEYDAELLAAILRARRYYSPDLPEQVQDDKVRYIT